MPERDLEAARLRRAEARYHALAAAAAQIVWTASPDGVVDDMPSWRAYTGQNVEEVQGWGWLRAVHPDDRARAADVWTEAVARRSAYETEYRVRRYDGVYRSFLVRGIPVLDDGDVREWIGIGTDATERKQAEAALRASEERLRTVIANAPIVLFAVDREGIFTLSEGRGLGALGIRPHEHVGQSYFALYGHLPDSVAAMQRTLAGEAATTVNRYKGLVFETHWMPTRGADGTVTGAIGVSTDITERAWADEERRRLEHRTRAALDALLAMAQALVQVPDGADAGPPLESVARRLGTLMHDMLDCHSIGVIGVSPPDHLRPLVCVGLTAEQEEAWRGRIANWPRHTDLFRALIARLEAGETLRIDTGRPEYRTMANPFGIDYYLLAPMRVGAVLVGMLSVDYGQGTGAAGPDSVTLLEAVAQLAALVLERERLQNEREEARSNALALHEANRRMDEFLSIASHELKTPLTSLKAAVQLAHRRLRRITDGGEAALQALLAPVQNVLGRTEQQMQRMEALVDDLLDISRIQAGHLALRLAPCDLAAVVRDTVEEQRQTWPQRTITLTSGEDEALPVLADAQRIAQVVTNYLTNALKYSAADQPITVTLTREGGEARVGVRDRGPGIAASAQEHIWERFYRVEGVEPQSGSGWGLGLGLHICRTIMERHQGRVGVESVPGQGSTFWFALPLS